MKGRIGDYEKLRAQSTGHRGRSSERRAQGTEKEAQGAGHRAQGKKLRAQSTERRAEEWYAVRGVKKMKGGMGERENGRKGD